MEPHELAIAALSRVAHSSTSHRDTTATGKPSRPSGSRITNNTTVDNAADVHLPLEIPSGLGLTMSQSGRRQEDRENLSHGLDSQFTSNNSQSTTDGFDVASTPPTSTSDGFSSQGTNAEGPLSQLSQLSQLAAAQRPLNSAPTSRFKVGTISTAGHKRTADGQVKSASSTSPESPLFGGHSRNASAVSNVSSASTRIGELSSELRARLSYAMVKVNNGWQSKTIDEVESLASQKGSPTSSSSTLHGRRDTITSPRTAMFASVQGKTNNMLPITQAPIADFDLYSRSDQPSRTYESFWRDHSTTSHPNHKQNSNTRMTPPLSKSLAPPPDIRPAPSSRRSSIPKFTKPPTMPSQGSISPHRDSAPHTPRQGHIRENGVIHTPSQKTIQEQDAIETLLFMSSPGNSGNMGHTFPPPRTQASPQQSPLRAEFNIQPRSSQARRVGFESGPTRRSTESSDAGGIDYRSAKLQRVPVGRARSEAIDRLLDEMGDSSSDEDEQLLKYSSPRRTATGRV